MARRYGVNRSKSRLIREAKSTGKSALGLVPKVGTALGVYDTAKGAVKTVRAAKALGKAYIRQTESKINRNIKRLGL